MSPEDQAWYEAKFDMFSSQGWKDFQKDVGEIVSALKQDIIMGNKDVFDNLQGQLQAFTMVNNYEETIRQQYDNLQEEQDIH